MKILLLEPYFTGSHAAWAAGFQRHSRHTVEILSLPGRHWKWRMHGGAVTLARQFLEQGLRPDRILATDMLDLTTFLALTRRVSATIPAALYLHESQLVYPWSPGDPDPGQGRDRHYAFINYTSALAADAVLFNSAYHRDAFLGALPGFLRAHPDARELASVEAIRARARVLPLGLDLEALEVHRPGPDLEGGPPLVLWNHRWEHDKGPEDFFQALFQLADEGLEFRVAVLGAAFPRRPPVFDEARRRLGPRIAHFGFVSARDDYARWLWRARLLPVTSWQDFFGASVVEAMYCGCTPLLPRRLAYPEHVPPALAGVLLYRDQADLVARLRDRLRGVVPPPDPAVLRSAAEGYGWRRLAPVYDACLETLEGE